MVEVLGQTGDGGEDVPVEGLGQEDLLYLFTEGGSDAHRVLLDVVDDGGVGHTVLLRSPPQAHCPSPTGEEEREDDDEEEEGGSADEGEDDNDAAVAD